MTGSATGCCITSANFRESMMWLLPFARVSLQSRYSSAELLAALERITRPERPIREQLRLIRPRETATFIGHVSKDRLEFRRAIRHRNSFCPYVTGRIVDGAAGSRIDAVLRPHPLALAFMLGWLIFVAPWAVTAVLQLIEEGASRAPVIALTTWAAIYPICMLGFVPEARRTLAVLHDIVS